MLQPLIILYVNCLTHTEPGIKDVKVFCNSVPLFIYLLNNLDFPYHTIPILLVKHFLNNHSRYKAMYTKTNFIGSHLKSGL